MLVQWRPSNVQSLWEVDEDYIPNELYHIHRYIDHLSSDCRSPYAYNNPGKWTADWRTLQVKEITEEQFNALYELYKVR